MRNTDPTSGTVKGVSVSWITCYYPQIIESCQTVKYNHTIIYTDNNCMSMMNNYVCKLYININLYALYITLMFDIVPVAHQLAQLTYCYS